MGGRSKRSLILSVLVALTVSARLHATVIIIVRTDTSVFIGTDSLRTIDRAHGIEACKIIRVGETYGAAAGVVEYATTGFSLRHFIERAAHTSGSLNTKMAALDTLLLTPLMAMASEMRREDPTLFATRYLNRYFVQVAFVRMENGEPVITQHRYMPRLSDSAHVTIDALRCPSPACPARMNVFVLGETGAFTARTDTDSTFFLRGDTRSAIHELIQLQIQATPDKVGPPVNILRIDAAGPRWVDGGAMCGF